MTATSTSEKSLLNKYGNLVVCLLLTMAILAVFWQMTGYDFVNLDDNIYVTENPHVQAGVTLKGLIWSFGFTDSPYWHPLTWFSHMLDCQLFGLRSGMHHLTNLLLHLLNSLLLFLVLRRMTGSMWKSALVAAVFALHPLNVESVAWVASRKNLLSTLFWLLTLLSYAHYVERPNLERYLLMCLLFALGLMAKPMLVTLPFVLLLLDYWPLGRFRPVEMEGQGQVAIAKSIIPVSGAGACTSLVVEKVPLLVLSLFSICLTSFSVKSSGIVIPTALVPMPLRIENALVSYVDYIAKMFWPRNLAVFYPYPTAIPAWQALGAACLLLWVSLLVWRARKKGPYLVTGWLWYLGTLVPVIGLKQAGIWPAMADHFSYVPLIGLFIIIAWGSDEVTATHRHLKSIIAVSAGVVLFVASAVTWTQLQHWKNSATLFQHALKVTSNNYLAHNNLGNILADQGNLQEAVSHYQEALKIEPNFPRAHNNLGRALARQGKVDEAVVHYREALQLKPNFPKAHNNLANALAKQGKMDEAVDHYRKALELEPNFAGAHNNLANILEGLGKTEEAVYHYSRALHLKPDFAEAYFNLGNVLARQGKLNEAQTYFTRALELRSDFAEAHNSLGVILAQKKRLDEAIVQFTEALRLKPTFPQAQNNLRIALQQAGGAKKPPATEGTQP